MTNVADMGIPESPNGMEVLIPTSRAEWRRWLADHPDRIEGAWLVYRKRKSGLEGPVYADLLDEALCFGWIDSRLRKIDEQRVIQWYSPRRRGGIWSDLNKAHVERLVADGLMTSAGLRAIDEAKADGSWYALEGIDEIPPDLEEAFRGEPDARVVFDDLADSARRQYLWWIKTAKRKETRNRRIAEIVSRLLGRDSG